MEVDKMAIKKSVKSQFTVFLLGIIGFFIGKYLGGALLIPLISFFLFYLFLAKFRKDMGYFIKLAFSIQAGQLFWIFLAAIIEKKIELAMIDILVIGGALIWLILKLDFWPILFLIIMQIFGLILNIWQCALVDLGSIFYKPLLVHIVLRELAVFTLICGYWQIRKERLISKVNKEE